MKQMHKNDLKKTKNTNKKTKKSKIKIKKLKMIITEQNETNRNRIIVIRICSWGLHYQCPGSHSEP